MKQYSKLLLPVIMAMLLGACSQARNKSNTKNTNGTANTNEFSLSFTDSLAFISTNGDTAATIEIAIADDERERSRGLMHVTNLGESQGMLFIFGEEEPQSFWMANTPLPLDIIFVNAQKQIVRIHHNTPPFSQENFISGQPALYAVETNGGFTISHDIHEGMKVQFTLEE